MHNKVDEKGFVSYAAGPNLFEINQDVLFGGNANFVNNNRPETIYVTLSGSDSFGDGSFLNPYKTISKAINAIASYGNNSTTNPYLIELGAGTFVENTLPLILPASVGIRGQGQSLSRITTTITSSTILKLGFQTFVFGIVINGGTSYTNNGIDIEITSSANSAVDISFLVPRVYHSIIANCNNGITITGISGGLLANNLLFNDSKNCIKFFESINYTEIQNSAFNFSVITGSAIKFENTNTPILDSDSPVIVANNLYFKNCDNAVYSVNSNQTKGTKALFSSCIFNGCSNVLNLNDSSNIFFQGSQTYRTLNYEFFQGYPGANVSLVNSSCDFNKIFLQPTGIENFDGSAFDSNDLDGLRMIGPTPSVRFFNNRNNFLSGGAWRLFLDQLGIISLDQNTDNSGSFSSYARIFSVNSSGSIFITSFANPNALNISGSTQFLNQSSVKFLQPGSITASYVEIMAPNTVSSSHSYKLPSVLPNTSSFLQTDISGNLRWVSGIGGENNTASNLGNGFGLFSVKVLEDLRFKSLVAGAGVTFTSSSSEITMSISSTGESNTASNLGSSFGLFAQKSGIDLQFKSLVAGSGIQIASSSATITIATTGSGGDITSASNLGSGVGLFAQKNLGILEFKTLNAITNSLGSNIVLSSSSTEVFVRHKPISQTIYLSDDWIGNTAVAGRCSLFQSINAWRLDNLQNSIMEWRCSVPNLSTVAIEFSTMFGWADALTTISQTNGLYFLYDRLNFGTNWQLVSSNAGVKTTVNSGVAVTAAIFNKFKIETNTGLTRADFYIDDILVGSISTNLPTGTGKVTGIGTAINKTAGNGTARTLLIDYFEILANIINGR